MPKAIAGERADMRLFVSVDLGDLADAVADAQEPLEPADGLRLTDPDQVHVTLKFLGETDPDQVDAIVAALERAVDAAEVAPFEAAVEGYGVFPHLDYITVVWLGFGAGSEPLTRLHEAIERETTDLGFDAEDHDFTPHATIARLDHAGGKERVKQVVQERDPSVGRVHVDAIHLVESQLRDDGPVYETVATVNL
jgi:2'-5' RNA ligase